MSVCLFLDDNSSKVKINGFSPNLVCTLMLLGSGLGLLIGKNFDNFWQSYLPVTYFISG